jgi:hypothetical protein
MKNFSELLATNLSIDIELVLRPVIDNGAPHVEVVIDGKQIYSHVMLKSTVFCVSTLLLNPVDISITMSGKQYSVEQETAVVIESLKVDGFDLVPRYLDQVQYAHDQGQGPAGAYIGFNGHWQLKHEIPFYQWKHTATGQGWLLTPIQ